LVFIKSRAFAFFLLGDPQLGRDQDLVIGSGDGGYFARCILRILQEIKSIRYHWLDYLTHDCQTLAPGLS